jgi:NAD(P)-dependent dehydrogenase (short-subunit alcohol dehydrogenase family)
MQDKLIYAASKAGVIGFTKSVALELDLVTSVVMRLLLDLLKQNDC